MPHDPTHQTNELTLMSLEYVTEEKNKGFIFNGVQEIILRLTLPNEY